MKPQFIREKKKWKKCADQQNKKEGSFSPPSGNPLNWNCCKYIQSMNHKKNNKYFQIQHKACVGLWFATNLSRSQNLFPAGGVGLLPYISHIGMCHPKGYGFIFGAFLVWKQVYTLPIWVWIREWFSRELWERTNVFIVIILTKWGRAREKELTHYLLERNRNMRIRNAFQEILSLRSSLSNYDSFFA